MTEEDQNAKILEDQQKTLEIYSKMLEESNQKFEESVRELSILRHLGDSLLYAQDLKKIGRVILEVVVDEFDTEFGSLMLLNQEKNVLELFSATSQMEETIKYFDDSNQVHIPMGEGIAGCVAAEREPILIPDTRKDDRFVARSSNHLTRSLLCMPLIAKDKILGVINLSSPIKDTFSEKDKRIMTIVSDQAALAIENAILTQERVKNERISSIGKMAATIVHDIKHPMANLKGFAELMGEEDTSLEERKEFVGIIVDEIERFVAMTEELMEFTRGGDSKLNLKTQTMEDFVNGLIPILQRDCSEAKIELLTAIEYNAKVEIDAQKLRRVIFNLSNNARDAMEGGGKLTIRSSKDGEYINLAIADTGKGIPLKILGTLFEPFVTHGKANGTGLGLAIVKKIIEDHGGTIGVQSEEGKGTEFNIRIPVQEE